MIDDMREELASLRNGTRVIAWAMPCGATTGAEVARMDGLLDATERARARRLPFVPDRVAFSCAHALLRVALSALLPRPPWEWEFAADAFGRPHLIQAQASFPVHFSLTHTRGMAACALAVGHEIGIDAEGWAAARFFNGAYDWMTGIERGALQAILPDGRNDAAVRLWTLKEAALKAVGRGLDAPLGIFEFSLDPPILQHAPAGLADDWQVTQMCPTPAHVVALAVHNVSRKSVPVEVKVLPYNGAVAAW